MMDTKIKYDQARESRYIPFPLLDLFYSPLRLLYIKGVRAQITPFTILPKVKK